MNKIKRHTNKLIKTKNKEKYKYVFINGKQVRIKKSSTIDGISIEEYIELNADPIWLHENKMWEHIKTEEDVIF